MKTISNEHFSLLHDLFGYIDGLKYSSQTCLKVLEDKDYECLKRLLEQMRDKQQNSEELKDRIRALMN